MKIDLDGLECLEAVVDAGSFALAAERLHKTQPAVSYGVRQLEIALGVRLFDRSGHRARLTPAGQAILAEARPLLAQARRIQALGEHFTRGVEPRLRLVVDGALRRRPLLQALHALGLAGVPTSIQVQTEFLTGVLERFDEEESDLLVGLDLPARGDLATLRLADLEFVLLARQDHPALRAESPHTLATLRGFLEVSVHDSARARAGEHTNLLPGAQVLYVGDFAAKKEALLMGLGIGWMPLPGVEEELARGALVEVPFLPSSRRTFTVHLGWRASAPLGPTATELLRRLERSWGQGAGIDDAR
jgi:DNA-binding transcriptional LysR family regulator